MVPGDRGRGRVLAARPGDGAGRAGHDPGPQAGALRPLPGGGDDLAGRAVRGPGRPVPVRGADHRLHRGDPDAVPVRADAGRGGRRRLAGRDDQGPAGARRAGRAGLRVAAGLRGRQRHRRRARRAGPGQHRVRRQHPGHRRADLQPLRVRLRGDLGAADHRRGRRHGAGPPGAAGGQEAARPTWPRCGCAATPRPASIPARCRPPACSPGTTRWTRRRCCPTAVGLGAVGVGHPAGPRRHPGQYRPGGPDRQDGQGRSPTRTDVWGAGARAGRADGGPRSRESRTTTSSCRRSCSPSARSAS